MRIVTDAPLLSTRTMSSREWDELLLRQERWLAKRSKRRRRTGSGGLPAFLDSADTQDDRRRNSFDAH
jgi:hypothetical protein